MCYSSNNYIYFALHCGVTSLNQHFDKMTSGLIIIVTNLIDFQADRWFYRSIQEHCISDGRFEVVLIIPAGHCDLNSSFEQQKVNYFCNR